MFLYAGAAKVLDRGGLAASIRSYELPLPEWFVTAAAVGLPYLEILLGLYLISGLFTRFSAAATGGLMAVFIFALLQGVLRGIEIDCGCFGSGSSAETGNLLFALVRDVGLLALALQLVFAGNTPGRFSVDALINRGSQEEGASGPV